MAETWSGEFYCVKCKEKREADGRGPGQRQGHPDGQGRLPRLRHQPQPHPRQGLTSSPQTRRRRRPLPGAPPSRLPSVRPSLWRARRRRRADPCDGGAHDLAACAPALRLVAPRRRPPPARRRPAAGRGAARPARRPPPARRARRTAARSPRSAHRPRPRSAALVAAGWSWPPTTAAARRDRRAGLPGAASTRPPASLAARAAAARGGRPPASRRRTAAASVVLVWRDGELPRDRLDPLVRDRDAAPGGLRRRRPARGRPVRRPGRTACLRCVDAHLGEADPRRALVVEQVATTRSRCGPGEPDPALRGAGAGRGRCATSSRSPRAASPATWSATVDLERAAAGRHDRPRGTRTAAAPGPTASPRSREAA